MFLNVFFCKEHCYRALVKTIVVGGLMFLQCTGGPKVPDTF